MRRALWALGRLRSGRLLKASLHADHFEISERTAYRDFEYLRDELQVPVEFDRERRTFFLTGPIAALPPVTLSRGEVAALIFAEKVAAQYRGTPFEHDLESALAKICELLPEDVSVAPEALDAAMSLDLGPTYTVDTAIFADLLAALGARREVAIRYRSLSSDRTTDRRVRPYHIFNHRGDWYMAAWDAARGELRDFALHRVRRVTDTTERYEIPKDFDSRAYCADAFAIEKGARPMEVAVRFSPRQARWIRERRWHPTAQLQEQLDGGCVLRMKVSGLGEMRRWVLQFGEDAEVLAPLKLRREVAAALRTAANHYAKL